jgi:phytoene synthase
MADSFDHSEALVRAGDKNRFLATLFAPQKYRRALYALYAFNLEVARTREMAREPMPGEIRLQWWRDMLGGAGRGDVDSHPVAAALRDTVVRYRLPPKMLSDLIDARTFDLYDEPVATVSYLEGYATRTSSALIELAGRILCDGRAPNAGDLPHHAGIAYAIAGLLLALPVHSLRRQLYLPVDLMQRYGAQAADAYAANPTTELRAVLADLRLRARDHLAAARALLKGRRRRSRPRSCRSRWWCRSWIGWSGAATRRLPAPTCRSGGGNGFSGAPPAGRLPGCSDYSAAALAPPIHWSRSASARAQIALLLAMVFSVPRSRVPSGRLAGICASGGNSPKLTFIGW